MTIKSLVMTHNLVDMVASLYAPHLCVGCGLEGSLLCGRCSGMMKSPRPCCYRCGVNSMNGRTCSSCRMTSGRPISVNCVTSYDGVAKALVWQLKFGRARAAADIMGGLLADLYKDKLPQDAIVVPIPTARKRIRARGYDQATLIARSFARRAGLQYAPLLRRYGSQEQKRANQQLRRVQLQGVYQVKDPQNIKGRKVIIIDDVMTTGSTLEEAARTLYAEGARVVGALVFARSGS